MNWGQKNKNKPKFSEIPASTSAIPLSMRKNKCYLNAKFQVKKYFQKSIIKTFFLKCHSQFYNIHQQLTWQGV